RRYMRNRERTVVKPYPVTDIVGLRDIVVEKTLTRKGKIGDSRAACSSPLTDSTTSSATSQSKWDRMVTLMKTSTPMKQIPNISGSTILRLSSNSTLEEPAESRNWDVTPSPQRLSVLSILAPDRSHKQPKSSTPRHHSTHA
ncbi:hypothetical protein PIB30_042852, partial [Stylosanthes scabra]|nr:hypothetical protein [Stylosanthes scabra]